MKIEDIKARYKCDDCKKEFNGNEVHTKPFNGGIRMVPGPMNGLGVILVEPDGTLAAYGDTDKAPPGCSVVCCPHCEQTHLFGFDVVK